MKFGRKRGGCVCLGRVGGKDKNMIEMYCMKFPKNKKILKKVNGKIKFRKQFGIFIAGDGCMCE